MNVCIVYVCTVRHTVYYCCHRVILLLYSYQNEMVIIIIVSAWPEKEFFFNQILWINRKPEHIFQNIFVYMIVEQQFSIFHPWRKKTHTQQLYFITCMFGRYIIDNGIYGIPHTIPTTWIISHNEIIAKRNVSLNNIIIISHLCDYCKWTWPTHTSTLPYPRCF